MKTTVILQDTVLCGKNYQIIKELNKYQDKDVSLVALNVSSRVTDIEVPVLNPTELYHTKGLVIATCLNGFQLLKKCPAKCDKMYYLWDLGDILYKSYLYRHMQETLQDIIVPSVDYAEVVSKFTKATVSPFELEKLWNLQKKTEKH
jgi:hypothetical protein